MDKFTKTLESKLLPLATKLQTNKVMSSLSAGMMIGMPLMIIGSLALVIQCPPADYTTMEPGLLYSFMKGWADLSAALNDVLTIIGNGTMNIFALVSAAGIGYTYANKLKCYPGPCLAACLASFVVTAGHVVGPAQSFGNFGGSGLLVAIVVSILTVRFMKFLIDHNVGRISLGEGVPPAIADSFATLVPMAIIIVCWSIVNSLALKISESGMPGLLALVLNPIMNLLTSTPGTMIYAAIVGIGWWFGIHDTAFSGAMSPFQTAALLANQAAYAAGTSIYELPYALDEAFYWCFGNFGGNGATFGLCLLLLFFAKSKQCKTVGKLAIIPSFFNINEPVIFGLPMMMNPIFIIPITLAVPMNCLVGSIAMGLKLVPHCVVYPGWNMWPPIGGFIATLSWKGTALAFVLLALDMLLYYPFMKVYDKQMLAEENGEIIAEQ